MSRSLFYGIYRNVCLKKGPNLTFPDGIGGSNIGEILPFNLDDIDAIMQNGPSYGKKSISIDRIHKKIFYSFLRETNAIKYAASSLKRNGADLVRSDDSAKGPVLANTNEEWLSNIIGERLEYFSLDNRIIVLQRSLAAWYHSKRSCWYKLSARALRSCFLSDELLSCDHLVKVCAALSKWHFKNLAEFGTKLDISIISLNGWTLYNASQILWSLGHMKCFTLLSFDYMNNVVYSALKSQEVVEELSDDVLHRILSANTMKLSQIGTSHSVLGGIIDYIAKNPIIMRNLSSKTLVSISSILSCSSVEYRSVVVSNLLYRALECLHTFTHIQAAHFLYNFTAVSSKLDVESEDCFIKLLYEFKEMIYMADVAYIPSMVCKLLYTFRLFLNVFDKNFISKCLSDLTANLHLLGPYSILGNLQCLHLYSKDSKHEWDEKWAKGVENTRSKLLNFGERGELVKLLPDGRLQPIENLKLWHYGMLLRFNCTNSDVITDQLMAFTLRVDCDPLHITLKDFSLFLLNIFANEQIAEDRNVLNSILLISSNLWNLSIEKKIADSSISLKYWNLITYALTSLGLMDVFERESGYLENINGEVVQLLRLCLKLSNGKNVEDSIFVCLEELSNGHRSRNLTNDEALIVKFVFFACFAHGDRISQILGIDRRTDLKARLINSFYDFGTSEDLAFLKDETANKKYGHIFEYVERSLRMYPSLSCVEMAYAQAFFLQDQPHELYNIFPKILIGELIPSNSSDINLWKLAIWLEKWKNWSCLSEYLLKNKHEVNVGDGTLSERFSNFDFTPFKVDYINENFNVGPYQCILGLYGKGQHSRHVLIFTNNHASNIVRRKILMKLGYNFVEIDQR